MPVQTHDIVLVSNALSRLQLFLVGSNSGQVYTRELIEGQLGSFDWTGGSWSFIGGPTDTQQLAAAINVDGLMEIFALRANGTVMHNKQTDAAVFDSFGAWQDIGAVDWRMIILGVNADGRLEAFALVDGGQAFHLWQTSPSGPWNGAEFFNRSGWKSLAAGRNADGRLELFAMGPDNSGYHAWQLVPNGNWSDWSALRGPGWDTLAAITRSDGMMELFQLASGDVFYLSQLPDTGDPCQAFVDALAAARLHLIAVLDNPDHTAAEFRAAEHAVRQAQTELGVCRSNPSPSTWSERASLGAHEVRFIGVASNADGRLEVFALGGDSWIYHIWMAVLDDGWISQWSNLDVIAQQFAVGLDDRQRLVVVYTRRDGSACITGQVSPNGGWTPGEPQCLDDPEPEPTVTLTAVPSTIARGEVATLYWTSSSSGTLYLEPGIGFVPIPDGSKAVSPISTLTYTLTATGLGGTASASQTITVEAGSPFSGFSAVPCFNCTNDTLQIWLLDVSAGTWQRVGPLPSQKDELGRCPSTGSLPFVVGLSAAVTYQVVAVMPSACGGADDPNNASCVYYTGQLIVGDPMGPTATPVWIR